MTYDGPPYYPREYDRDVFAQCRDLLAEHGYPDYDVGDLDCDPDAGIIECPVKSFCQLIAKSKVRESEKIL